MKKVLQILRKHIIIVFLHIIYSAAVFIILLKGREAVKLDIDHLTDLSFLKSLFLSETQRLLFLCFISAFLLSIIYYFVTACVQSRKIYIKNFARGAVKYSVLNFFSYILWIPYYFIFAACIGIISIPSILIVFPLMDGKEDFFIPAIILWIMTMLVILFAILLFSLYMSFWYPGIFLITKNIFVAFKRSNRIVSESFWKLIWFSVFSMMNSMLFLSVIGYGFILLYKSVDPFTNIALWLGVILTSLLGILLKTYSFVFLNNRGGRYSSQEKIQQGISV